jgi:hypothetical protein
MGLDKRNNILFIIKLLNCLSFNNGRLRRRRRRRRRRNLVYSSD